MQFSADVTSDPDRSDFALTGLQGASTPTFTVDYDDVNFIATLNLSGFIINDVITLTVFDTILAGPSANIPLDGDFDNRNRRIPVRQWLAGEPFVFQVQRAARRFQQQ